MFSPRLDRVVALRAMVYGPLDTCVWATPTVDWKPFQDSHTMRSYPEIRSFDRVLKCLGSLPFRANGLCSVAAVSCLASMWQPMNRTIQSNSLAYIRLGLIRERNAFCHRSTDQKRFGSVEIFPLRCTTETRTIPGTRQRNE